MRVECEGEGCGWGVSSDVNFPGFRWDFPFSLDLWQKCGIWESGIWDFDPMFDLYQPCASRQHRVSTTTYSGLSLGPDGYVLAYGYVSSGRVFSTSKSAAPWPILRAFKSIVTQ